MSKLISEAFRIDFINAGAADGAGMWSQPFSMDGYDRACVIFGQGTISVTAELPSSISVYAGKDNVAASAMTALTSATASIGCTTQCELTNVHEGIINCIGTCNTVSVVVDGVTFEGSATGYEASSACLFQSSAASISSLIAAQLTTLIKTHCTRLDATYFEVAAATYSRVKVWVKDKYGATALFSMNTTAGSTASTDAITLMHGRSMAAIEFTAADMKSTNSSYTHFAIHTSAASSGAPLAAVVVRRPIRSNSTHSFTMLTRLNT